MLENANSLRIAWLLPVAWFYWQPALSEFTKLFPHTQIFTALFPGYARGFEDSLALEVIGEWKVFKQRSEQEGYGSSFTSLSLGVAGPLLRFRPDVVFSSSFGVWTILALLLKPLGRWKVILAYEGSTPGVDFRNSPLRLFLRRLMVKAADAFITNNQAGRDYLTQILYADPQRVFAQPYEIPSAKSLLDGVEAVELPIAERQRPLFLFVGRIMPRKGLHLLLQACLLLQKQGYENYTLLIVGDGEQRQELETFTRDHHLDTCVTWIGQVDYAKVNAYFRAADVFILPTLEDTWGVVVLEAMLFGKPVLCSTGAGSAEMVRNGENGYIFDPRQSEQLAELMQKFIDQPQLAAAMGERSLQIMAATTPEIAAHALAQVVNVVAAGQSQGVSA